MPHRLTMLLILGFSAFSFIGAKPAKATLLAYEPFNYSTGAMNGKGPGAVGLSGTWSGGSASYVVQSGNLTYPAGTNLPIEGNQSHLVGAAGNIHQPLTTPIDFSSNGTYYVSFLVQKNANIGTSNEFFFLTMNNTGDSSSKISMGLGSTESMLLGSTTSTFSATATNFYSANQTYLYLAKIVTNSVGNDQYFAKLLNVSTDNVPLTEPAWDLTYSAAINGTAGRIQLNVGSASDYNFDAFRLSSTFFDATQILIPAPEPSSLLLLSLGLVGLVTKRRRGCYNLRAVA